MQSIALPMCHFVSDSLEPCCNLLLLMHPSFMAGTLADTRALLVGSNTLHIASLCTVWTLLTHFRRSEKTEGRTAMCDSIFGCCTQCKHCAKWTERGPGPGQLHVRVPTLSAAYLGTCTNLAQIFVAEPDLGHGILVMKCATVITTNRRCTTSTHSKSAQRWALAANEQMIPMCPRTSCLGCDRTHAVHRGQEA